MMKLMVFAQPGHQSRYLMNYVVINPIFQKTQENEKVSKVVKESHDRNRPIFNDRPVLVVVGVMDPVKLKSWRGVKISV
jgi:predicted AAA+ superfamily ATPase